MPIIEDHKYLELRYLMVMGRRGSLQQRHRVTNLDAGTYGWTEWENVPTVDPYSGMQADAEPL